MPTVAESTFLLDLAQEHGPGFAKFTTKQLAEPVLKEGMSEQQARVLLDRYNIALHVVSEQVGGTHNTWGMPEDNRCNRALVEMVDNVIVKLSVG